ncbi:hypothetical protein [Lewinella sp. LCG006]|uniref:hypothetical protein n=1 Tax=Lewinella sp. LCG006 TaxID=3231911 RepID=UPI003460A03F
MKKSKLIDICKALTSEEWRELLDYVASPYFNKQEAVTKLAQHLKELARKNFPDRHLDQKGVWEALFPGIAFSNKEMAYLMSHLLKLIEDFLGQKVLETHLQKKETFVLEALAQKKLIKSYTYRLKKLKTNIAREGKNDAETYHNLYSIASIEDAIFNAQNLRQENPHLKEQNDALDQYFVQTKLKLYCNILNQAEIIRSDYQITWPTDPRSKNIDDHNNIVTKTYQCLFELLSKKEPNEAFFNLYDSFLEKAVGKVGEQELVDLYYYAINYCLNAINKGERQYANKLLQLYQKGLTEGYLLVNEELSPWIYKNIIKLGLGLKQFEWTEDFILNYTEKLPAAYRDDALYFNLSDLRYHQQQYDDALALLNKVDFSDLFYKHGTKIMLLKIYFEKDETEALLSLSSSYKLMLIREKELSGNILSAYKNFVRLLEKIYRSKDRDRDQLLKIEREIMKTKNINARQWLLEQIRKLQ